MTLNGNYPIEICEGMLGTPMDQAYLPADIFHLASVTDQLEPNKDLKSIIKGLQRAPIISYESLGNLV